MRRRRSTALLLLGALLLASSLGCGRSKPSGDPALRQRFELGSAPKLAHPLSIRFGNAVQLLGYSVTPDTALVPGSRVTLKLYWKLERELPEGWLLFTHVLDGAGERIVNADEAGPLRRSAPGHPGLQPGAWIPGKIYEDPLELDLPAVIQTQRITVVAGLYRDSERLLPTGGVEDGQRRAVVAELHLDTRGAQDRLRQVPRLAIPQLAPSARLTMDGQLDEPAWNAAARTGAFVDAGSGAALDPASPITGEARLLWDAQNLYVAFEVHDSNLVGGFPTNAVDPHLWTRDTVELMLDPDGDGDGRNYYELQVNPQNLVFDSLFDDYNSPRGGPDGPFGHQEWSAKLTSAVKLAGTLDDSSDRDRGYTVELALPFKSLTRAAHVPPRPGDQYRINLYAMQDNGGAAWSPLLGQGNFHRASRFGRIEFVTATAP